MKTSGRRWSRGLAAAIMLAAACMVFAASANAQRRECVDCHQEYKSVLKRSHVHAPAKEDCETCHKRHGFTQMLVLVKAPPELCTDCHESVKTEMETEGRHVHAALTKGGCTTCHDPHASDGKGLLRVEKDQTTPCVLCHTDLVPVMAEKDIHPPFRKGDCSACHSPHSSTQPMLLVSAEKDLCETCHKGSAARHKMPGVADFACSSCHDPHRSSKKTKLAANAHDPFASGDCESCHDVANGEVSIGDDFPPRDLCETCHDDVTAMLSGPAGHFGAAEIATGGASTCLQCHDPHVSGRPAMLVASQDDLCRTCHESLPQTATHKGVMHAPFRDGNCTSCHEPHGADTPHKLAKGANELCVTCHAEIAAAPQAGKAKHTAMESMACTDCHSGHAGENNALLARSMAETCADCHDKEAHRNGHLPYQTGTCESCHRNHSHEKGLLAAGVNETCGACHQDQIRAMGAATKHPPMEDDNCLLCHQPHGSDNPGLLAESQKSLCLGCHDVEEMVVRAGTDTPAATRATSKNTLHPPVADGECAQCHNPHGSPLPSLLVRTGDGLCFGCHAQEKIDFAMGVVHAPVAEGKCNECHAPHGSELGDLAAMPQPAVCTKCHDFDKPELQEAHKKIDVSEARCTACHAPHSSPNESLLNTVVHEPFKDGDCETCHDVARTETGVAKLGAVSKTLCFDCHDDKQTGKGHQQAAGSECVDCHQPHSSPFEHLLNRPDKLCSGCHAATLEVAADRPAILHRPIETGGCRECHQAHDAPAAPFLATAQKDLCSGCHDSVKNRKTDRTQHAPFGKGECTKCHETHVASEPHMLKTAEADLCASCHRLDTAAMKDAHGNVPLTGRACVSCHDPHSTKAAVSRLVYATKHPPYADKDCSACHDSAGKATASFSACVECHNGHDGYADVHDGGRSGTEAGSVGVCLDCHSPHAGHDNLLVRTSVKETCMQCHDRGMFTRQFQHAALDDGCETCHDVHANKRELLSGAGANELCAGCHDIATIHTHPVSGKTDPRNGEELKCVSCHEVHSADHEALLPFDKKRDICVQCHATGMN